MKRFVAVIAVAMLGASGLCHADEIQPPASASAQEALPAQKAILYEEDLTTTGAQYAGAAVWHNERLAAGPGQKLDALVQGDIEIPERNVSVHLTLRRNDDRRLPSSHMVEIMFTLPPDFPHGGVDKVPGILMKPGEATRGFALNGVAVKAANNYFLVGLSSANADIVQRNVQLLKEQSWLSIPLVYGDGKRALLTVEKGLQGERVFADAFDAWSEPVAPDPGEQTPALEPSAGRTSKP